ncbi:MAG: hypothetical protein KGH69_02115 [Candidatus Micrarchaeota archaeon]|nr:hypothetical protein [Candidatus Micrarchaeota archaeon]
MTGACLERRIENRQTLSILALFLIAQFLGLLIAILAATSTQVYLYQLSEGQATSFVPFLLSYLAIFSIAIILVFRFLRKELLLKAFGIFFRLLEWALVIIGASTAMSIMIGYLLPAIGGVSLAISVAFGILLIALKSIRPTTRNAVTLISSTGFGVLLGFYGFYYAYLFAALIAVYDYISVFITKHMLTIAEQASSQNLAFMISSSEVEVIPSSYLKGAERKELRSLASTNVKDPYLKGLVKDNKLPTVTRAALGNGDIIIPIMLAVGSYVQFFNYYMPLLVIIFAGLGMMATMAMLKRYKVPLPAIPPLFAFINLGLAIGYLEMSPGSTTLILSYLLVFVLLNAVLLLTLNRTRRMQGV